MAKNIWFLNITQWTVGTTNSRKEQNKGKGNNVWNGEKSLNLNHLLIKALIKCTVSIKLIASKGKEKNLFHPRTLHDKGCGDCHRAWLPSRIWEVGKVYWQQRSHQKSGRWYKETLMHSSQSCSRRSIWGSVNLITWLFVQTFYSYFKWLREWIF